MKRQRYACPSLDEICTRHRLGMCGMSRRNREYLNFVPPPLCEMKNCIRQFTFVVQASSFKLRDV